MFGFLPDGKKIVGCKWMFKVKRIDGTFEQYKAHKVAKGFTQHVDLQSQRWYRQASTRNDCQEEVFLHVLDISNAFLIGGLSQDIYIDLPPGYAVRKRDTLHQMLSCDSCIKKSIYGLKQASRQWLSQFSTALMSLDFAKIKGPIIPFSSVLLKFLWCQYMLMNSYFHLIRFSNFMFMDALAHSFQN